MTFEVTPERQKRKIYSDASPAGKDHFTLDDLFDCIRACPRWAPKFLAMNVSSDFVGAIHAQNVVTVYVVPTAIHTAYDYYPDPSVQEEHEVPEYEFEGWLLGDYPEKIWVIGSMLVGNKENPELIDLVSICRLEPGEEIGTAFNPLVAQ